jgi:hypothetical protein
MKPPLIDMVPKKEKLNLGINLGVKDRERKGPGERIS